MGSDRTDTREKISTRTDNDVDEPPMYKVLLHNDDYTTMEFVIDILVYVFKKTAEEAIQIMLAVHNNGIGTCGVYPLEIAETKVDMVKHLSEENGFPLKCTLEKD